MFIAGCATTATIATKDNYDAELLKWVGKEVQYLEWEWGPAFKSGTTDNPNEVMFNYVGIPPFSADNPMNYNEALADFKKQVDPDT